MARFRTWSGVTVSPPKCKLTIEAKKELKNITKRLQSADRAEVERVAMEVGSSYGMEVLGTGVSRIALLLPSQYVRELEHECIVKVSHNMPVQNVQEVVNWWIIQQLGSEEEVKWFLPVTDWDREYCNWLTMPFADSDISYRDRMRFSRKVKESLVFVSDLGGDNILQWRGQPVTADYGLMFEPLLRKHGKKPREIYRLDGSVITKRQMNKRNMTAEDVVEHLKEKIQPIINKEIELQRRRE